jgi:hypothetical protein
MRIFGENMDNLLKWFVDNKEWIFSGIGVSAIGSLLLIIYRAIIKSNNITLNINGIRQFLSPEQLSLVDETDRVINEYNQLLINRVIRRIPYAVEVVLFGIIIPYIINTISEINIFLLSLTMIIILILLQLISEDIQLKRRIIWARKTKELISEINEIKESHKKYSLAIEQYKSQISSIYTALCTLQESLRTELLFAESSKVIKNNSGNNMEIAFTISADMLRNDLLLFCKYICEILEDNNQHEMRCGILIQNPKNKGVLLPIVVFNPKDTGYTSQSTFSMKTDFSGILFSTFNSKLRTNEWKNYSKSIISDTQNIKNNKTSDGFPITLRKHQTYINSIAGNVIYYRNNKNVIVPLGIINIDSPIVGAIQEERYLALRPYLFPIFRLIASRMIYINKYPEIVSKIWNKEGRK